MKKHAFSAGQRVRAPVRLDGETTHDLYGTVVWSKTRRMKPDGVGDVEDHVRVFFDDNASGCWVPISRLEAE